MVLDYGVLEGAEATTSDSATDTLKTGSDQRFFGPPPGLHLPNVESE